MWSTKYNTIELKASLATENLEKATNSIDRRIKAAEVQKSIRCMVKETNATMALEKKEQEISSKN